MLAWPAYAASQRPSALARSTSATPRGMHAPLAQQPLYMSDVALGPAAARTSRREALAVGALVAATDLTVDPAVAERLVERLLVGEASRLGSALLGEHQPHTALVAVVLAQPPPPRVGVHDDQLRQYDHGYTAFAKANKASAAAGAECHLGAGRARLLQR